ncbi:PREDICTED: putative uncharacterized protein DDB_G0287457 [Eufriesea mexicana]|uniref:putative uncharacterized protein DDB_G0287457 n=1 Tax=Eufriesea mexicana TaxID=516756 RepID=UPI00083C38DD|nr:PREDICTED: putative uncharacterized protein DDB_G0287457 [Eufriesea mexicana]
MSKNKVSTKICNVQHENSKTNNVQEVSVKMNMKVDVGNDSPQHSYDSRVYGHSTPIQKRDYVFDIEDSPEIDYRCSPISMPFTQDGGNEIAWDWQTSVNKVHDKPIQSNNHIETPKRTKQLQKKRNSNSPLLQKPLKRKQVKMENIENIGKLTAELKALSEKMKSIQENCNNHMVENENDLKCESNSKLLLESDSESSDDIIIECVVNRNTSKINSSTVNSNNKKITNYEDLFDDSIDDSMVRCSQEIEEKLNLCKDKVNNTMQLSTVSEEKETSTSEKEIHYLTAPNISTECSRNSSISKTSSTNTSGYLKTYSNNSNKINSTLNVSMSNSKVINNNVINVTHGNQIVEDKSMSDFPDDSFDDCLATCIEDDKLLSKLSEYDFSPSNSGHNTENLKKISKHITSNTVANKTTNNFLSKLVVHNKGELITDDLVEEVTIVMDKKTIQNSFPSKNSLENRKFFKTKSLSDQCFYQNKNTNINNKTTNAFKSEKRYQSNLVTPSIRRKRSWQLYC